MGNIIENGEMCRKIIENDENNENEENGERKHHIENGEKKIIMKVISIKAKKKKA